MVTYLLILAGLSVVIQLVSALIFNLALNNQAFQTKKKQTMILSAIPMFAVCILWIILYVYFHQRISR